MRLRSRLQQSDRARNVPGWLTGVRAAHLRLKPKQAGAGERHGPVPAHPVICPVVAVQPQALLVQCGGPVEVTRAPGRRPVDWVDLRVGGRAEGVAGVGQRSPRPGRRARGGRGKRGIGHAGRSVPACSAAM